MTRETRKLERYEVRGFEDGKLWRSTVVVCDGTVVEADVPLETWVGDRWWSLNSYVKLKPGWRVSEPTGVPHSISRDAPTPIEDPWRTKDPK